MRDRDDDALAARGAGGSAPAPKTPPPPPRAEPPRPSSSVAAGDRVPAGVTVARRSGALLWETGNGTRLALRAGGRAALLEGNPAGRALVYRRARRAILAETRGNLPAPPAALEAVREGIERGPERGYRPRDENLGD